MGTLSFDLTGENGVMPLPPDVRQSVRDAEATAAVMKNVLRWTPKHRFDNDLFAPDFARKDFRLAEANSKIAVTQAKARPADRSIYARERFAPSAIIGYWTIVLVERAAGIPLGDWLDSRHSLGLGLPIASTSAALLLAALESRRRATSGRR